MRLLSAFISPAKWSVRVSEGRSLCSTAGRFEEKLLLLARSRSLGNVNFESGPLKKERIHREEGSSSTSLRLSYSERGLGSFGGGLFRMAVAD